MILKPEYLLLTAFDGDRTLRFWALYSFLAENNLEERFQKFLEDSYADEPEEWQRIVEEAKKLQDEDEEHEARQTGGL